MSTEDVERLAEALHRTQFVSQPIAATVWAAVNEGERDRWRVLARAAVEQLDASLGRLRTAVAQELAGTRTSQAAEHADRRDGPAVLDGRVQALEWMLGLIDEETQ